MTTSPNPTGSRRALRQSRITLAAVITLGAMTVAMGAGIAFTRSADDRMRREYDEQLELDALARQVRSSSELLTQEVRNFTVTGDSDALARYWEEIEVTQSQAAAIERMVELGVAEEHLELIETASANSAELVETETRAMRLVLEAQGVAPAAMPAAVGGYELSPADAALAPEEKTALAASIVFDDDYEREAASIMAPISEFQEAVSADATAAVDGAHTQATAAQTVLVILLFAVPGSFATVLWLLHSRSGKVIQAITTSLRDRDTTDLTFRLEPTGVEELRELAAAFNDQLAQTSDVIAAIAESSVSLAGSSEELSAVSQQLSASAEETSAQATTASAAAEQVSANVQTVASGAEQMGASIGEIATNATEAARVATQAVSTAETTNATVTKLSESSAEIGEVIKVITSIAEQTNLLALNATIEAARAGEAGKGFAVVANEVKELAKETAKATEDIGAKILAIQSDAVSATEAIGEITEVIGRINDIQTTIASAVEEQTATTAEISRSVAEAATGAGDIAVNVSTVAQAAGDTSTGASTTLDAASDLSRLADDLQGLVGGFTYARSSTAAPVSGGPGPRPRAAAPTGAASPDTGPPQPTNGHHPELVGA